MVYGVDEFICLASRFLYLYISELILSLVYFGVWSKFYSPSDQTNCRNHRDKYDISRRCSNSVADWHAGGDMEKKGNKDVHPSSVVDTK